MKGENMEKAKAIRKVRSKNYPLVLEVLAPVRFYWTEDGDYLVFDGIEVGPLPEDISRYQVWLIHQLMEGLVSSLGGTVQENESTKSNQKKQPKIPMPDYIIRAFREDKEGGAE